MSLQPAASFLVLEVGVGQPSSVPNVYQDSLSFCNCKDEEAQVQSSVQCMSYVLAG